MKDSIPNECIETGTSELLTSSGASYFTRDGRIFSISAVSSAKSEKPRDVMEAMAGSLPSMMRSPFTDAELARAESNICNRPFALDDHGTPILSTEEERSFAAMVAGDAELERTQGAWDSTGTAYCIFRGDTREVSGTTIWTTPSTSSTAPSPTSSGVERVGETISSLTVNMRSLKGVQKLIEEFTSVETMDDNVIYGCGISGEMWLCYGASQADEAMWGVRSDLLDQYSMPTILRIVKTRMST